MLITRELMSTRTDKEFKGFMLTIQLFLQKVNLKKKFKQNFFLKKY